MNRRSLTLLVGFCAAILGLPSAQAHHSVVSEYDTDKVITIDGQIQSVQLGNPHSHLTIRVPAANGGSTLWQSELASLGFLYRAGWTATSLTIGEHVRLIGAPSRRSATEMRVTSVIKQDGTRLATVPAPVPGG
jgi:hypothetical protein